MKKPGFTLVELLVVIAIIIALLAILLPSMGRAVFNAQVTQCAARLDQLYTASLSYASDELGWYPISPAVGAVNPIDVSDPFIDHLNDSYGMSDTMYFCPLRPAHYSTSAWLRQLSFSTMGYCYWVRRSSGSGWHDYGDASAPRRVSEEANGALWTDALLEFPGFGYPSVDTFSPEWGRQHEYGGKMVNANVVWRDGSVQNRPEPEWEFRYQSGNARMWY